MQGATGQLYRERALNTFPADSDAVCWQLSAAILGNVVVGVPFLPRAAGLFVWQLAFSSHQGKHMTICAWRSCRPNFVDMFMATALQDLRVVTWSPFGCLCVFGAFPWRLVLPYLLGHLHSSLVVTRTCGQSFLGVGGKAGLGHGCLGTDVCLAQCPFEAASTASKAWSPRTACPQSILQGAPVVASQRFLSLAQKNVLSPRIYR